MKSTSVAVIMAATLTAVVWRAQAVTNIWQAGTAGNASDDTKWSLGRTPIETDDILLNATSVANLTWDAAATNTVASWTQTADYTGTITFSTVYDVSGFTMFTISGDCALNGGKWTHLDNATTEAYRLNVIVGGNLTIANASINTDALGYDTGRGPGTPPGGSGQYEGGTHGGIGGAYGANTKLNYNTYGSLAAPVNLGSGGQNSPGGGAVLLTVAGTTTIGSGGLITAVGSASSYGGGAGGSIWLTTGWLNGSGAIRADGASSGRGNGGGGRVSIVLTGTGADFASWSGTNTAYGGSTGGPGAAGTVHRSRADGWKQLLVVNNGQSPYDRVVTLMPDDTAVDLSAYDEIVINGKAVLGIATNTVIDMMLPNVKLMDNVNSIIDIQGDENVTYPANWVISNVTIRAEGVSQTLGSVTIANSGILSHQGNTSVALFRLNLNLSGDMTVLSNGMINANGKGYSAGSGPGGGASQWFAGAHGGVGNASASYGNPTTTTYGDIKAPTTLGSGGNVAGGGAIELNVAGTTTVSLGGIIAADGLFAGSSRGGGAGGSVYLTTGQLTGGGLINANGNGDMGSGGGRVAICLTGGDFGTWTGKHTAYGGSGGGGPGTVYTKPATGLDSLIIDNNGQNTVDSAMARMTTTPAVDLTTFDSIVIKGRGTLGVASNTVFNLSLSNVVLADNVNSVIDILNDTHVTYPSPWVVSNVTIRGEGISKTLGNVTIANTGILSHQANLSQELHNLDLHISGDLAVLAGGQIHANGKGYRGATGPGSGAGEWFAGAYGGYAGGNNAPNVTAKSYGSILSPVNTGSGGGNAYGAGAVRLRVSGTTTVEGSGSITANGADMGSSRGGGSGGSIWITTPELIGEGSILANGGSNGGGGGRVAIELASAYSGGWTGLVAARGGNGSYSGAAGTVRLDTPFDLFKNGTIIVENNNYSANVSVVTPVPAFADATEKLKETLWIGDKKAQLAMLADASLGAITLQSGTTWDLKGKTLTVGRLVVADVKVPVGTYAASEVEQFSDSVGDGLIKVVGLQRATLFIVH